MNPAQVAGVKLPQVGDVVGRYSLRRELGTGGMAVVFAAIQQGSFERPVACKFLLPHLCGDEKMQALFAAEARLLGQLADPHIPTLFEAGQANGVPFMAMELLVGETLEARLLRHTQMDTAFVLGILTQVAQALEAAHAARGFDGQPLDVVHRDVSPQNIHLGSNGVVKLLDFGIAASRERHRYTRTGELRGKLQYLAPEQITRTHPVSPQSDLWALGVVARELVTGQPLFRGDSEATTLWNVTAAAIRPLAELAPTLPAAVCEVFDRCLRRDPDERPASASEVRQVLALALEQDAVGPVRRLMVDWTAQAANMAAVSSAKFEPVAVRASHRRASVARRIWVPLAAVIAAGLLGATALGVVTPTPSKTEAIAESAFAHTAPPGSDAKLSGASVRVTTPETAPTRPINIRERAPSAAPPRPSKPKRRFASLATAAKPETAPAPPKAAPSALLANPY